MKIDDAIQWLNNRGHMFERSDINKVAKVGHYLFVKEKEETEVDLYCLTDMYAECQDCFSYKDFKWTKDYMRKCITGEVNNG